MVIDTTNEKLYYEFYQKPTHSGRDLHYSSHCAMSTKINIIKTEARRIIKNCMYKQHSWPHLEKSREDFIQSGYPEHLVTMHIIKTIAEINAQEPPKPKINYDFTFKIPYISEAFTRIAQKTSIN